MRIFLKVLFVLANLIIVYQLGCKDSFGNFVMAEQMPMSRVENQVQSYGVDIQGVVKASNVVGVPVRKKKTAVALDKQVTTSSLLRSSNEKISAIEKKLQLLDKKMRLAIERYKVGVRNKFKEIDEAYRKILSKLSNVTQYAKKNLFENKPTKK